MNRAPNFFFFFFFRLNSVYLSNSVQWLYILEHNRTIQGSLKMNEYKYRIALIGHSRQNCLAKENRESVKTVCRVCKLQKL